VESIDLQWVKAWGTGEFMADDVVRSQLWCVRQVGQSPISIKIRRKFDVVDEYHAIRRALVSSGNPACRALTLRLTPDGEFELDVNYSPRGEG
jgi:hypothetical protein